MHLEKKEALGRDDQGYEVKTGRVSGCFSAEIVSVIKTVTRTGDGTGQNPNRFVTEYWSLQGELLAMNDPGR